MILRSNNDSLQFGVSFKSCFSYNNIVFMYKIHVSVKLKCDIYLLVSIQFNGTS